MPKTNSTIFPHALLLGCNATPSLVGRTLYALADGAVIPAAGRTTLAAASPSSRPSSSRDTSSRRRGFHPHHAAARAPSVASQRAPSTLHVRELHVAPIGVAVALVAEDIAVALEFSEDVGEAIRRESKHRDPSRRRRRGRRRDAIGGEVEVVSGCLGAFAARASIGPGGSHVARRGVVGGGGWAQAGGSIAARRGRVGRHATAEDPLSPRGGVRAGGAAVDASAEESARAPPGVRTGPTAPPVK